MDEQKAQLDWTSTAIDRGLHQAFKEFAHANGISMKRLLESLIQEYLAKHGVQVSVAPRKRPWGRRLETT